MRRGQQIGLAQDPDVVGDRRSPEAQLPGDLRLVQGPVAQQFEHPQPGWICQGLEGIDQVGLGRQHLGYLLELFNAQGVPKGLSALAGRLGLDEDVVSGSIEPVLLSLGMIDLTGRGRVLTKKGHLHLAQTGQI